MRAMDCLPRQADGWLLAGGLLLSLNLMVILYLASYCLFDEGASDRFWRVHDKLVASQTSYFYSSRIGFMFRHDEPEFSSVPSSSSATGQWAALADNRRRLLLIVNEAWGEPQDERIQQALLAPLQVLPAVKLGRGNLEFVGVTVLGELRELCHLAASRLNLVDAEEPLKECLPHRLRRAGYRVQGMHAASSLMYARLQWYAHAGFDRRVFFETHAWPDRCYSWPGACDLDMRQEVRKFFAEEGAGFLYWLTLNTHHGYDLRDLRNDVFDCAAFAIEPAGESCRNLKLQAQFFSGLAELMAAPEMQGVEVMIVGDHEPIIVHKNQPVPVFQPGRVPWITLSWE